MNNELQNDIDYGSTIDRTIHNGVISVDGQGRNTVFKNREFVLEEETKLNAPSEDYWVQLLN